MKPNSKYGVLGVSAVSVMAAVANLVTWAQYNFLPAAITPIPEDVVQILIGAPVVWLLGRAFPASER